MKPRSMRGMFVFLVVSGLLPPPSTPTVSIAQASPRPTYPTINTLAFATGTLYTQPFDPSGKLLLSARLDPNGSNNDQTIWDNFTLSTSGTITEIDWIGGYDPLRFGGGGPVVNFHVSIYPSITAGTEPAISNPPLVQYQTGGNAGETSIGTVGGTPLYTYAFNLPASFEASAGLKYWVQIEAWQHGSIPDWGIALGTGGNASHYQKGAGAGGDLIYRKAPGDGAFTLLGPVSDAPTDIFLSPAAVNENKPANTVVGTLSAVGPNPAATFTYRLACAVQGAGDGFFNILGISLRTSAPFDYETRTTYAICIRVTNQGGQSLDKNFIVTVNNVNERYFLPCMTRYSGYTALPSDNTIAWIVIHHPACGQMFIQRTTKEVKK